MGLSDFTALKQATITVAGQPFPHLLYHFRLAHSGWSYVQVMQGGESFLALAQGLQNALWLMGGHPKSIARIVYRRPTGICIPMPELT